MTSYRTYSYDAKTILDDLTSEGFVRKTGEEIVLTGRGEEAFQKVRREFNKSYLDFLKSAKDTLNDLSRMELLAFMYRTFEDMVRPSLEREKVSKNLLRFGMVLFKKRKISLGKGAQIAGMSSDQFFQELKKKGIKVEVV